MWLIKGKIFKGTICESKINGRINVPLDEALGYSVGTC